MFTSDKKALFSVDTYYGLYYADPSPLYDSNLKGKVNLVYEKIELILNSLSLTLCISPDENNLIIGFRSTGIKIFKIDKTNYKKITFV